MTERITDERATDIRKALTEIEGPQYGDLHQICSDLLADRADAKAKIAELTDLLLEAAAALAVGIRAVPIPWFENAERMISKIRTALER